MSMRDDNTVGLFYHEAASCIESWTIESRKRRLFVEILIRLIELN